MALAFSILPESFAILGLDADATVPCEVMATTAFASITRTKDELSIVCPEHCAIQCERADRGWRCLKVHGPFAFDQIGILASLLDPLAEAAIGVFTISTFDTDYILVKAVDLVRAVSALQAAGHRLEAPESWDG